MTPPEPTVLVTGGAGLLGAHVLAACSGRARAVGVDHHPWWGERPVDFVQGDLEAEGFVEQLAQDHRPSVVVHCAAMVNVDGCERDPMAADRINAGLTARLVRAVGRGCQFVYITTDGIFDGLTSFRREDDPPAPRTAYGRSKWRGEREVQAATDNHLIVRTNFYGWSSGRKQSSAEWLYGALVNRESITAFTDFFFTPIYVVDFVERLQRLIDSPHRGVIHLCGRDRVSKHDFVMEMARAAGLSAEAVKRGSIDDAHLAAPRPKDMSLSTERASAWLGEPMPTVAAGLRRFLADRGTRLGSRFGG